MSAFAQRAPIGGLPPDPRFTGDALLISVHLRPAGKMWSALSSLPPGHWALVVQNLVEKCVEITPPTLAKPGGLVRSRWLFLPDYARTEQVGGHQAVYVRI